MEFGANDGSLHEFGANDGSLHEFGADDKSLEEMPTFEKVFANDCLPNIPNAMLPYGMNFQRKSPTEQHNPRGKLDAILGNEERVKAVLQNANIVALVHILYRLHCGNPTPAIAVEALKTTISKICLKGDGMNQGVVDCNFGFVLDVIDGQSEENMFTRYLNTQPVVELLSMIFTIHNNTCMPNVETACHDALVTCVHQSVLAACGPDLAMLRMYFDESAKQVLQQAYPNLGQAIYEYVGLCMRV